MPGSALAIEVEARQHYSEFCTGLLLRILILGIINYKLLQKDKNQKTNF